MKTPKNLKIHKFARRTFYVDAVRVSAENMELVAEWCEGTVKTDEQGVKYIFVDVHRPLNDRQTQAFIGDWVLFAGNGFKVYIPKAFDRAFERVRTLTKEQADAAGIKVPHEPKKKPQRQQKKEAPKPTPPRRRPDNPVISEEMAAKINAGNIKPGTIQVNKVEPAKDDQEAARLAFIANQEKKAMGS